MFSKSPRLTDVHARGVQPLDGPGGVAVRLRLRLLEHLDEVGAEVLPQDLEGVIAALVMQIVNLIYSLGTIPVFESITLSVGMGWWWDHLPQA